MSGSLNGGRIAAGLLLAASWPVSAGVLELAPCGEDSGLEKADCGAYRVFEDRASGEGREIDINVVVLRRLGEVSEAATAVTASTAKEPLWLLAGGPGQGGTIMAAFLGDRTRRLREDRDIVMADQRGTGDSNPLDCLVDGSAEQPQLVFGHLFAPENIRQCRRELEKKADLRLYTSELAADDFDEIRQALGYDKVVPWGGSYGTRFAMVWLQRHPESVAGVVLDSPAPMALNAPLYYARDAQRALDKIISACTANAACLDAMPSVSSDLAKILRRFDQGPIEATVTPQEGEAVTVEMSRGDFGYAIRGMLYRPAAFARMGSLIHQAAESGDLSTFAQAYYDRWKGLEPFLQMGLHLSVFCAEDTWRFTDGEAEVATQGTFLSDYLVREYRGACELWPRGEVSPTYWSPEARDVPALILNGDLDPVTPPTAAKRSWRSSWMNCRSTISTPAAPMDSSPSSCPKRRVASRPRPIEPQIDWVPRDAVVATNRSRRSIIRRGWIRRI